MSGLRLAWEPPGPVSAAFMQTPEPVQGIMGPIGSGKTSTILIKMIRMAASQRPSTVDGKRKFKFCVVRDTYRQLWKTVIPSWHKWVTKTTGEWTGGDGEPAKHAISFRLTDTSVVELTAEFVAIGENKVEDVLRGYEPTAFYLNEADLLVPEVLMYCRGRAGRYPSMNEGGPTWRGVMMDYNAPDTENYLYKLFEEDRPAGHRLFKQPSGFSAAAENLKNLPPDYYEQQANGQPDWYVRRMLRNEYGYSRDGKPVYEEFNDAMHVAAEPLRAVRGLPLLIAGDAGGTPAGVIGQRMPDGQWRIYEELISDKDKNTGPTTFSDALNLALADRYKGWSRETIRAAADPSAQYGGDGANDEDAAWLDKVRVRTKLNWRPAPSNAPSRRQEAVRLPLMRLIDGRTPGLLISPTCKVLRKGFNSGYRFARQRIAGSDNHRYSDTVEKNEYSHVHDALQYLMLTFGETIDLDERRQAAARAVSQTHAITDADTGAWGDRRAVMD